jgi:hypothetical protein
MQERISLLEALSEQQIQRLRSIHTLEKKIGSLEQQVINLNNANELRILCLSSRCDEQLLHLRWSDNTAADADAVRKVIREILQEQLQNYRDRLQRIVETEESRLATLLKQHGNSELPTSDSEIQD